ncbi:hypothetical protein EYS42_10340 [Aquabacterium lacunae]|uniref:Ice-binding protein C-terminal domain-containing protein n=1 Tax=Aquabacterium lacunae TaxID=2528630 RepID=A0A4Q9H0X7_9BURK|nr:PEP-CTERM sorting domain-containing protein [Aquabacterium lacunae]TBO30099.1 hypothetical protein EYS42_10340 [Aquabacterium lacunae]
MTALVLASCQVQAADLLYTFDSGAQGFVANGATLVHQPGFLSLRDIDDSDMVVVLPAADLGDWSRFVDGTFAFDAINLNGAATDWGTFGTLRIESGSTVVERDVVPQAAPAAQWTTYRTTLDGATWASVLGNVTRVTLMLESHIGWDSTSGYELNGLDNVRVSAVPEPQAWALGLVGVALVAGMARRRQRAA